MDVSAQESLEDKGDGSESFDEFQQLSAIIGTFLAPDIICRDWDFLPRRSDLLRIDMRPTDFVMALELQYEFLAEQLAELGLYERVDDELRPASWLEVADDIYVSIDESNRNIAFSDGNDFLFPINRTSLDYAVERLPADCTQAPATLFIVHSQDSVEVMKHLDLPAVSCKGLDALGGDDISKLFDGNLQSDFGWRFRFLLLDFDLARLKNQPQKAIQNVINRLADAAEVFRIDPARRFGVCRPTARDFQLLERTIAFKQAAQIRQVFENWSTAAQNVTIGSWRSHFASEMPSFSDARAALHHALQLPSSFERELEVPAALAAYRAAGQGPIMQKFYEVLDRTDDPFDKVDLLAAASLADAFFDSDPLVRMAEAVLARRIPHSASELWEESLGQRERFMVAFRRIRRELKGKR